MIFVKHVYLYHGCWKKNINGKKAIKFVYAPVGTTKTTISKQTVLLAQQKVFVFHAALYSTDENLIL